MSSVTTISLSNLPLTPPLLSPSISSKKDNGNPNERKTSGNSGAPLPFSYTYGSMCLLCLRTKTCTSVKTDPEKHHQSRQMCLKYIVLLSRYMKLDTELTKISQTSYFKLLVGQRLTLTSGENADADGDNSASVDNDLNLDLNPEISKLVICDSCHPLAESFCKMYQEYELLRMKLEAKVLESKQCVEKSEVLGEGLKVTRGLKKVGGAKGSSTPESGNPEDVLMAFRNSLKNQGSDMIKCNLPRLQLKRTKEAEELIQNKLVKLTSNHASVATKNHDNVSKTAGPVSARRPNPKIKIVRRPAGRKSDAPEISIVRLSESSLLEDNENNNNTDIDIVQRKTGTPEDRCSVVSISPPHTPGNSKQVSVPTLILNASIFKSNHSLPSVYGECRLDVDGISNTNDMLPLPILIQKCNINGCGITFPKTEQGFIDMHSHLNTHGDLPCTKCTAILKTPFELINHELKHDEEDPTKIVKHGFQCSRCLHYSMLRTEHQEHFLAAHLHSQIELLKCPTCKKGFSHLKQRQYQTHMKSCHPNANWGDASLSQTCVICSVNFKKKGALWKHLKGEHRVNCREGPHRCSRCTESFFFPELVELHQEFSCDGKQNQNHQCPHVECNSTFIRADALKRHLTKVHNSTNSLECPICKQTFYDENTLKYHIISHNGEQVKLVFSEGNRQEPQVIPVDSNGNVGIGIPVENSFTNQTTLLAPIQNDTEIPSMGTNIFIPTTLVPSMMSGSTPIIVAVSGTSQIPGIPVSSFSAIEAAATQQNSNQSNLPVNHCAEPLGTEMMQPDIEHRLFKEFFDDSNDYEEPLMNFFGNTLVDSGGVQEDVAPPDEDPFSWMLTEDFEIS